MSRHTGSPWNRGRSWPYTALLAMAVFFGAAAQAQSSMTPPVYPDSSFGDRESGNAEERFQRSSQQKLLRRANEDRRKKMLADSDRLLVLTTQLDADLAAHPAPALSGAQQVKLAEIQKLARQIRKRMTEWNSIEETTRFSRQMNQPWR